MHWLNLLTWYERTRWPSTSYNQQQQERSQRQQVPQLCFCLKNLPTVTSFQLYLASNLLWTFRHHLCCTHLCCLRACVCVCVWTVNKSPSCPESCCSSLLNLTNRSCMRLVTSTQLPISKPSNGTQTHTQIYTHAWMWTHLFEWRLIPVAKDRLMAGTI